ncbi:MAG: xanthan lyase [Prevotella sp.]|nr:xanthan lyase [Prevotella sp.]
METHIGRMRFIYIIIGVIIATIAKADSHGGSGLWGHIDYDGEPWVKNTSLPYKISKGLYNRHVALWASHGRYYDAKKKKWKWQRPNLFCTNEDLFTQTIVVPYLIPMLENAGAVVFTPRERDWQTDEIIIDNDTPSQGTAYVEAEANGHWTTCSSPGFAFHKGTYSDQENPFAAGTVRQCKTTKSKKRYNIISYQPYFQEEGRYAVYVSYQTVAKSIDDACYTVWHKGEKTTFKVNQQMGGGTWVYLGTFDFDKGSNEFNRVELTSQSKHRRGIVTADAVRFGGGMGNIVRGGTTSGMPRCVEGARYYAQWAGMPYNIYSSKNGTDDYGDDINVRSLMTNYVGGGSPYMPSREGLGVPIELSLAIHSDAGYRNDETSLIGSLAVVTTRFNDGRLNAGISRLASRDFAQTLLSNIKNDIGNTFRSWPIRELRDQNYSETRLPEVPSAIIETLSHQNFNDMRLGLDPAFRFTMARSLYKSILKYVNRNHGNDYIVTPLTPDNFSVSLDDNGKATLSWTPVMDNLEPTARPTSYVVYTATGSAGFDNGTVIGNRTNYSVELEPGVLYSFRIAALNKGGRSFLSEVLCALYNPYSRHKIMIVNGFDRLSSPAVVNRPLGKGFDIDADPGVTFGKTAGWCGRQVSFNTKTAGGEGPGALGYSTGELEGKIIAGNDFNYVRTHAMAIMTTGNYSIVSSSAKAIEAGLVSLSGISLIDMAFGLQRSYDGLTYKTFTPQLSSLMKSFTQAGGSLLVSGSYITSDQTSNAERQAVRELLHCDYGGSYTDKPNIVRGMSTDFTFHHSLNATHYAATSPDILQPVGPAFSALTYANGQSAAVAYQGQDYRSIVLGIPFECISDAGKRKAIMRGLIDFLLK